MMRRSLRPRTFRELLCAFQSYVPLEMKIGLAVLPVVGFTLWSTILEPRRAPANLSRADIIAIPPIEDNVKKQVSDTRKKIADRAAIDFHEDFRNGFSKWNGVEDWGRTWSHDIALGAKPSKLAVFKPSIPLRDYQFAFIGQIEKKALSWVFRAADLDNYYVMKLVQVSAGPMPTVRVFRYAVVNGEAEKPVSTPLPFVVTNETVYRVNVDVKGDSFTLYIDGKVADVWSDSRFKSGGVGFFSDKDEAARVLAMRVSHQVDTIGKAAAYISETGSTK